MLVNTFGKKISASLIVKNSEFYIEVAKFVQAYIVILNNPNEFLAEIGEPQINKEKDKISWSSLSKIMQKCDFGFSQVPTNSDLLVFYNYALEMGSISKKDKRIASVDEIADAQKIYYNFVDEAKDRAEAEYLKQHRISKLREKEVRAVENTLMNYSAQKWTAFSIMIVAVIVFCIGVTGFIFSNPLVEIIGSFIPAAKQYVGATIVVLVSIMLFCLCDKWHLKSKQEYFKLDHASRTIFSRNDQNFITEQVLKYKLDVLKRDLETIHNELNDENKSFDVKNNIEKLIETNDYYKKYFKNSAERQYSAESKMKQVSADQNEMQTDNNKLMKEEMESVQHIILEGQFDEQAYNEKFEKSERKLKKKEKKENQEEKQEESSEEEKIKEENKEKETQDKQNDKNIQQEQINQIENQQKTEIDEYLEYIEKIVGLG